MKDKIKISSEKGNVDNEFLKQRKLNYEHESENIYYNKENEIKKPFSNNNDNINTNKKFQKKIRNPGIDLVRLIGMYCIILNHFLTKGRAYKKFSRYRDKLFILNIFTDWDNDGFGLISGIVGYKTNRYSNLLYLWITVLFYTVGINLYIGIFKKSFPVRNNISIEFFPIIFRRYWYFTAYFGMYLLLPIINKGIAYLTKQELKLVVLSTLGIFVFWRDFKNPNNDVFNLNQGFSLIWLLIYYITGAYIGKYRNNYYGFKKFFSCIIYINIYMFSTFLYIKIKKRIIYLGKEYHKHQIINILNKMLNERYDSFLKISQSITICLFFLQINFNKYISKIITFLAPLAFGIYLIHMHPLFKLNILPHSFDNEKDDRSAKSIIILLLMKSLKLFIFCIFIDYFRNLLFSILKIKNICFFIEAIIYKIFN